MRLVSLTTKIQQLSGLVGTRDVNAWETQFIRDLQNFLPPGQTTALSDKQVEVLERLWSKNFS